MLHARLKGVSEACTLVGGAACTTTCGCEPSRAARPARLMGATNLDCRGACATCTICDGGSMATRMTPVAAAVRFALLTAAIRRQLLAAGVRCTTSDGGHMATRCEGHLNRLGYARSRAVEALAPIRRGGTRHHKNGIRNRRHNVAVLQDRPRRTIDRTILNFG